MSMLAEPRRKVKWSVDPRNSTWSNDDSKFGQKMLERMGWSKGKGLGRSEQGSTDHIKVKLKNDSYGLGANVSYEDNWIAHQDDFNELLAQLNNHHGQNKSSEPLPEEEKGFSLEEKSKMSRKRVHYTKFTKGKDLSSRTETDLNCIFGRRTKPVKEEEQVSSSSDSQDETSVTNTVTSSLSMQEYFAQRMARLKKGRGPEKSSMAPKEASPICSHNEESKKKKKKSKKAVEEPQELESSSTPTVTEEDTNQEPDHPRKKKKKRKMAENDESCILAADLRHNCEELPPTKKKKKSKKHNTDSQQINRQAEQQTVKSEVTEEVEDVMREEEMKTKKKKSKKKRKNPE
ncbi:PIN2/TERF1-interacting telomerase inhibitor 1 [Takifugu flavidus]|uniref:PIN2/TERF1-interacting telomerase inhibitor 1 n=1 Tax=Takifugu flavidus TaxID=433684 RepID=UPI0025446E7D|nr:PIN2/TERF1-interacting telomerase inhibitor 1 [Takifugu flavidus]